MPGAMSSTSMKTPEDAAQTIGEKVYEERTVPISDKDEDFVHAWLSSYLCEMNCITQNAGIRARPKGRD